MPVAKKWTNEQDQTIMQMRKDGRFWAEIADIIGVSHHTVIARAHRLGAHDLVLKKPGLTPMDRQFYARNEALPVMCELSREILYATK